MAKGERKRGVGRTKWREKDRTRERRREDKRRYRKSTRVRQQVPLLTSRNRR